MYDILIKHGQIVDGSGAPAFYGDIAVKDGKIARIAPEIDEPAQRIIDAGGNEDVIGCEDPPPSAWVRAALTMLYTALLFKVVTSGMCCLLSVSR